VQVKSLQEQLSLSAARIESLQSENQALQALVQKYREEHDLKSTLLVCEISSIINQIASSKDYEVPVFSQQRKEYQDLWEALQRVKQKVDKARGNIQVPQAKPGRQAGRRTGNSRDGEDDPQNLRNPLESVQTADLSAEHKREPGA